MKALNIWNETPNGLSFFDHLNEGVGVWEGDFKDSRTGEKFQMIVNIPAYGEPIEKKVDLNIDYGVATHSDEQAVAEEAVVISRLENNGYEFEPEDVAKDVEPERIKPENLDEPPYEVVGDKIVEQQTVEPQEIVLSWSEEENRAVPLDYKKEIDFDAPEKPTPSLEIGTWDDVKCEVIKRRIPEAIANDVVEERFSPAIDKASWERMVDSLSN